MTESWLTDITAWVAGNPGWLTFALFATALTESLAIAGILVPGVALLFALAMLAGTSGMGLAEILIWAGCGAVAGDTASFALGRLLQGRLHSVWPLSRYPRLLNRGERFFRSHGGKSVVIGRFVGPVRPVMPLVAGAFHMPWPRFLAFNLLSAAGWALVYVLPGFAVGSAMTSEIKPPPHFYPVLAVAGAVLLVTYVFTLRLRLGLGEGSRLYRWLEQRMANYDATHRFWRLYTNERPSRRGEFPLPSLILAVVCLALFAVLAQLAALSPELASLNALTREWFGLLRQPLFDAPMVAITMLGDTAILLAAATLAVITLAFRGYYAAARHIAAAAILTTASVALLKAGIDLNRPDAVAAAPESGAFPSGHTAGITVVVTLAASFIAAESRKTQRWPSYLAWSLPLIPIALSRLYLGVHWLTDVLGGLLLGLAITGLIRASYSRYDRVPLKPDGFSWLALAVWLVFVAVYFGEYWQANLAAYRPA
ncbi:undecaprenyl-diphosphatase [Marinobacter persicus]|uniref:Undecaprenyl-diphosphatase n=1 Tax=Marinobacter persicus TaxID=930118 RepID=A0A1I3ULU1_9GAMM|nr:VTT domain-containing protein [Marinobacter persicus]GHD52335.1 hypothetical protein GCM10008110_24960 [Marinobacter persicus]SFJ83663.1 undecaprenyl-diphosphatase [Marinobacter persicus]